LIRPFSLREKLSWFNRPTFLFKNENLVLRAGRRSRHRGAAAIGSALEQICSWFSAGGSGFLPKADQ
jgi:hypothetical protein